MASLVRRIQIKKFKKRGLERDYAIKDGKLVQKPWPRFLPKENN